ncbi:RNA 2',3'-cyclic phosphodiesterase [Paenibacillus sp. MMS18-CY102]|uniref:RNA 2',3'-cyclic phosphodiesterase n=1 Tax=Paenibacillus sp. MMS18-CY102 TaxID=2682849 RepID=UPI001365B0EA|nr:RNA 2',3'-cyclic phosphodiesterase [Paenibacillus sp. MMS18-CY102]MWC27676.1 RNA 2',3'-cyclic phosphodiesterase [Paenibacillus sp. MMS18-CY102]
MNSPSSNPAANRQRLFVAVPLPEAIKKAIGTWSNEIRDTQPFRKWTHEADLHITLQFLGDTEPSQLPELIDALASAARSGETQPFRLTLQDVGVFGMPKQPRVLWIGLHGELDLLSRLHQATVSATAPLGFSIEARPYSPHLTIARSYTGSEPFVAPQHSFSDKPLEWDVNAIVLYRTHMHERPMYEEVARFPL